MIVTKDRESTLCSLAVLLNLLSVFPSVYDLPGVMVMSRPLLHPYKESWPVGTKCGQLRPCHSLIVRLSELGPETSADVY